MADPQAQIWFNGTLVSAPEANVSVMSHALHYGSSVFEGIRAYQTNNGSQTFRLREHLERLHYSAGVYRIPVPYSVPELTGACLDVVQANGLTAAYIRPIVFRGNCGLGVIPRDMAKVETAIIAVPWGAYLGDSALTEGVNVCISSWQRSAPNTIPAGVKAGGNYLSSQLVGFEARDRGCAEGVALGANGLLSEGAGENIFVINDGLITTPPQAASILNGITRDTAIVLARDLGYTVLEQDIAREQLYAADEIFFTGTAAEITPVCQVDHVQIGEQGRWPVTKAIQSAFFGLFDGSTADKWGWLQPVLSSTKA